MSPHRAMRTSILLLALVVVGCQPDETVTVSGAVSKPGNYRFAPGRPAAEYVEDAGGATEEALTVEAYVLRSRTDTSAAAEGGNATIPLSDNPELSPGDEIRIPARVYDVRLDTVRRVSDVRLAYRDRIYRIPSGALVTGRTERGVQVAVMLGRGEAIEPPDTAKAVSAFHYLYIHLHPGEYPRLARFAGEVLDSMDVLDDARVIHTRVVSSLEHRRAGGLQLAPDGYWRVIEGFFLAPRKTSRPARGMRRRRFRDGRVLTTFPNGRERWQHPDGRVRITSPGGATEDRLPDGRIVFTDRWKNVRTTYPDGRINVTFSSGATEDRFPDGRIVFTDRRKNVRTTYPDGRQELRMATGGRVMLGADGTVLHSGPADSAAAGPDSLQAATARVEEHPRDTIREPVAATRTGGDRPPPRGEGSLRIIPSNEYGKINVLDGTTRETFPDGRRVETDHLGQRITIWPDGKKELRMPAAYGYPGELKTGLATVERLPEAVDVGEELTVTGQIHAEVEGINVMAFLVPDGGAIEGDVRRAERRFHARFRFGEAGHCRVQVQVVLPKARTYTVSHQSVIVGNPDGLEDEVLEILPYPGDEAAQLFLIDRINASRKRIRRRPVSPHPELMHVARIRLEEMLAQGILSHYSMAGLDVGWHTTYRRLPFHRVSENVARTRFVETMHAGWMLSAGHRANILAKHWTHVGVAVAEAEESVWGVQVFGQRFNRNPLR